MTTLNAPVNNVQFWKNTREGAPRVWTSAYGNTVWTMWSLNAARYAFDFKHCTRQDGWRQFDTHQDASYFGIWIHDERRHMVTYAEGDLTVTECHDSESFELELKALHECHGAAPPAAIVIDQCGELTEIYDERARHMSSKKP